MDSNTVCTIFETAASVAGAIGTVSAVFVAIHQNKKLKNENERIRKLEEAKLVSIVSVKGVRANKIDDVELLNKNSNCFNLVLNKEIEEQYYVITVLIENLSKYPIVSLCIHPGDKGTNPFLYNMINICEKSININAEDRKQLYIKIPSKIVDSLQCDNIVLYLDFTNIFNYHTEGRIILQDFRYELKKDNYIDEIKKIKFNFRLSKFTDVNQNIALSSSKSSKLRR